METEKVFVIPLPRLQKIALECAARAVIDSSPPGSPGQPLIDALAALEDAKALQARHSQHPADERKTDA